MIIRLVFTECATAAVFSIKHQISHLLAGRQGKAIGRICE